MSLYWFWAGTFAGRRDYFAVCAFWGVVLADGLLLDWDCWVFIWNIGVGVVDACWVMVGRI